MAHSSISDARSSQGLRVKIVALMLHVRWQNVVGLAISQYVAAVMLFNDVSEWQQTLSEGKLHGLIFSVAFLVAGGYLINNFYDREKDRINRPIRTAIESNIRKSSVLYGYLAFTLTGSLLALLVSGRAFLYYSAYAFLLWAYSHKFKRITLLGNLVATLLVVVPFFGLLLYYHVQRPVVVYYGFFYSWLFFMRESVKDIRYYKGDMLLTYQTVPVVFGLRRAIAFLRAYAFVGMLISLGLFALSVHDVLSAFALLIFVFFVVIWFRFRGSRAVKWAPSIHTVLRVFLILGILVLPLLR